MDTSRRRSARWLRALLAFLGLVLALGWSIGAALAADSVVQAQAATLSYDLTLRIGPMEQMLSADVAKAQHITSGEIMAGMPGMGMSTSMAMGNHHVEVKVTGRGNGRAIKDATVAITLTDTTTKTTTVLAPVLQMYGAAEGESDWHYGNNIQLPDGIYRVDVIVNGERATFSNVVVGASDATMAMPGGAPAVPARLPETGAGGSYPLNAPTVLLLTALIAGGTTALLRFVIGALGHEHRAIP